MGLMKAPDSPQSVAVATRWRNANYLRHAIVLTAWLASLRTFSSALSKTLITAKELQDTLSRFGSGLRDRVALCAAPIQGA